MGAAGGVPASLRLDAASCDRTDEFRSPRLFQTTGSRITPQVEWVEIQVKSVLNRVQGMPFKWSANPYRGCAHSCLYCISGDTPVLMADGTTRPMEDLVVGDEIYGTIREGRSRRYVKTHVLAHWSVRRPSYSILLEDGTEVIASGDHRFLTDRGWKFVTGTEYGRTRRPHLTTNTRVMGVGCFASAAATTDDYKRGYLCGLSRGDAHLASSHYERVRRTDGDLHQFRLALTDTEALDRAREYLHGFSIPTLEFIFQDAGAATRRMQAIRPSSRGRVDDIRKLVEWPHMPSQQWCAGFLAGILDAEGGYSRGILRITTTDPVIVDWIIRSLNLFGFTSVVERRQINGRKRPLNVVRLPGGLPTHLRFFHTVDPAVSRKRDIEGQAIKSRARLRVKFIAPIGRRELFDIATGTGDFIANGVVSHNCYARLTHWYLDQDGGKDWSSRIFVKVNAPEVLRRELARPTWKREQVHIGTATDPYQPAEGAYRITRQILEALRESETPVALVTKSTMIIRDRDVLRQLAEGPGALVMFSFTTVDPELARELEPDVPPPQRRMEAMRALAEAGHPHGCVPCPGSAGDYGPGGAVGRGRERGQGVRSLRPLHEHPLPGGGDPGGLLRVPGAQAPRTRSRVRAPLSGEVCAASNAAASSAGRSRAEGPDGIRRTAAAPGGSGRSDTAGRVRPPNATAPALIATGPDPIATRRVWV